MKSPLDQEDECITKAVRLILINAGKCFIRGELKSKASELHSVKTLEENKSEGSCWF